jgi:Ras-related protein Rab-11A
MSDEENEPVISIREKGRGEKGEYIFKICIVGEPAVGKTSLLRRFVKNQFETKHIKTVGVDISKQPIVVDIDGKKTNITLLFWDLAGQVVFHLLHKVYLNGAMGIMIAFDLTREKTLTNVEGWKHIVTKHGYGDVPTILVGNKADLKAERTVKQEDIDAMMKKLGIVHYFEASALDGQNVAQLFESVAKNVFKSSCN